MEDGVAVFSHLGDKLGSYEICTNLLKYYHRPVTLFCDDTITDLEVPVQELGTDLEHEDETPKFVNKGTQTDYRESESQTDPWDPPYKIIKVNQEPEVLILKEFSYGNGLPATKLEVDYVIQTRENNKLIKALKGDESEKAFVKRKEILKDQIKTNWNYKVAIENEKQLKRLEEMKSSLINELNQRTEKRGYILENMWKRKKEEIKKKCGKLEEKLRKEIKVLENSLQDIEEGSTESFSNINKAEDHGVTIKKYILSEENMDYLKNNFSLSNFQDLVAVKDWLEKKQTFLKNNGSLPKPTKKTQRELLCDEAYENYLAHKKTKLPPEFNLENYKPEISLPNAYSEDLTKIRDLDENNLNADFSLSTAKPVDLTEFVDKDETKIDMVTVWEEVLQGLAMQKQMLNLIEKHKEDIDNSLSKDEKKL